MMNLKEALNGMYCEELGDTDAAGVTAAVVRVAGRRRAVRAATMSAGSLAAVGALAFGAVSLGRGGDVGPANTPDVVDLAEAGFTSVTFDLGRLQSLFQGDSTIPKCGVAVNLAPTSGEGLSVRLALGVGVADPNQPTFGVDFVNDGETERTVLAASQNIILVKDGVALTLVDNNGGPFESMVLKPHSDVAKSRYIQVGNIPLCATYDAIWETRAQFVDEQGNIADEEGYVRAMDQWADASSDLEQGTYTAYAWSYVVFGEQAGAARLLRESGVPDLNALPIVELGQEGTFLSWTEGSGYVTYRRSEEGTFFIVGETGESIELSFCEFADSYQEANLRALCTYDWEAAGLDSPLDLSRNVPNAYIHYAEPVVLISEPVTFTVS